MTIPNPIGVGMVGAGWMGQALLARLAECEGVEVRGLCQRDQAAAATALDACGLSPALWTHDYGALLADPGIDAVFVCTPNALHGPQSIAALEAGKHLFCEKPAATRFEHHLRQIELDAQHPGLTTFVDYILWFDPMELELRRLVATGALGTIKQIQVNYRHPVNIEGTKAWKLRADTIGDAIGMGIIHALWAMLHAMEPQAQPVTVFATSSPARSRPFEVDPIWTIQVGFDNGATGICLGDIDGGVGYDAYHALSGTEGAFVFDSLVESAQKVRYRSASLTGDRQVWPLDAARCQREGLGELAWDPATATPDSGDVWRHQTAEAVAHFVACVQRGVKSPLGLLASRTVAELGWAALMSAAVRAPVSLPLDLEHARSHFSAAP